jgi:transposase
LAGARGRGTLEKDRPPILGLIRRGGQLVLRMLGNVRQKTIRPIIEATVAKGARVHTDEYGSYARLPAWGYRHVTVCHARGEYARDADGDGFCEIHVNTMGGTWSLLRSWLRPHRGISGRSCRSTSASSSSCTTPAGEARPSSVRSSQPWWRDMPPSPRIPKRA